PKTKTSRRRIPLTPAAVAALRQHRARQGEERLKLGDDWASQWDLVFSSEVGTPLEHGNLLRRAYWPLLLKIGLADLVVTKEERIRKRKGGKVEEVEVRTIKPRVTFHALRHTAATLLLEQGQHPVIVGALLGHARTSTTVDVYSHALPHAVAGAATVMDELLSTKPTAVRRRQ
ncbi:MAG TPA: tyrosine-type recombinase/integrase, partial [Thermoanaerobaculaceae bacterium]|nr:tyrosine-type recombinase/integrase [Thermoanaerobaculaceae bacterium]